MSPNIEIRSLSPGSKLLNPLAAEARKEGYQFVDRLLREARSGNNCFKLEGECFLGVFRAGELIACGGVNQDPYTAKHIGRVRHLYVLKSARRNGVASVLVKELLAQSSNHFRKFRLRTSDDEAGKLYEGLGFERVHSKDASHIFFADHQ